MSVSSPAWGKGSGSGKMSFRIMSFIHETLYALFRDPYKVLTSYNLKKAGIGQPSIIGQIISEPQEKILGY